MNEIPHDQKISGEIEFFDDGKFTLDLKRGRLILRTVAVNHAIERALAKEFHLRFVIWSGIDGKFVTEILERELQARSKFRGVGDGFRKIRKKCAHL